MPTYQFARADGSTLEIDLGVDDVVAIGETVVICGERVRRVASLPEVRRAIPFEHKARTLPTWDPAAPRHDPSDGAPVFTSKREVREYAAKTGRTWE